MKPDYRFLILLVPFFLFLELTHCADEEGKHEVIKKPVYNPKNRYIVEKTQNVTEKRESVPRNKDDCFQESFRKVRKVHKKLVNKKLSQYDETEDLERKRIKDSEDAQKKNIEEVQHVVQKMKIVANPNYPADKQNIDEINPTITHTSEQKQKPANDSETQKKVASSETKTKDEGKAKEDKEKVISILPSTETKRKSIIDSEIEREEENDKGDSLNTNNKKKIISVPERKGKKVIRTIYVVEGKNKHSEEEQDNLEAEYAKLMESTSREKEIGTDTEKRTSIVETEANSGETLQKQKKFTEVEEERIAEPNETKQSLGPKPRIKIRRIIVRRPVKIIRKNISRSAKEEEQKENRSEEQTFVDSEIRTVPIKRRKTITACETENDQSKNILEGSENSETIIEKPEGQESVKYITIKRTRSGKDTKRSDKTNTEDVEIITDSEEPSLESKTGIICKPKHTTRRIVTETVNEADSENDAQENRKKTVKVIDNSYLEADKNTLENNFNENEIVDFDSGKQIEDTYAEGEDKIEKATLTTEIYPTQLLETEIFEKSVPNKRKTRTFSKTNSLNEGLTDYKHAVTPRKVRTAKKQPEDKYDRAVTKSKAIAEIEEELRQMLSEASQTEKPKGSQKPKSFKGKNRSAIVTNKRTCDSETLEDNMKPQYTYNTVQSTDKVHPVFRRKNKIIISEIQEDDLTKNKKQVNVKTTTTTPRSVIKDKELTDVKTQEDTQNFKPYVDIMEPGTETEDINESQFAVFKKVVKPETYKTDSKISETDENNMSKIKAKKPIKSDFRKGSFQVMEADTDEKTNIVQDSMEPHSTTTKKSSLIEAEPLKKEAETEVKKQAVETDEIKEIKVVKQVTVPNETTKNNDIPETRFKIRQSDEIATPTSVIVEMQKEDHEVSEIDHETKNQLEETEVTEKAKKIPSSRPKIIKRIITTTVSETQNEQDDAKFKPEDKNVKPDMEFGGSSGSNTINVKKVKKMRPETYKEEDIIVPEIYLESEKVELVKESEKLPESNTVNVKKVRKSDSQILKEDTVAENKPGEVKPIKAIRNSPERISETMELDTKVQGSKTNKESGTLPESGAIIVKDVKKADLNTQVNETDVDFKDSEPVKYPESRTLVIKTGEKTDSETETQVSEADTKTNEVIPTKKTVSTGSVRKVNKIVGAQERDSEDYSDIPELKTTTENVKLPESLVVRKVTETQNEYSEVEPKLYEEKAIKDMGKTPESNTVNVKKEKQTDLETQTNVSYEDPKIHEVKTTKETGKVPESNIVAKRGEIDSETQIDNSKTFEVKTNKETEMSPQSNMVIVKTSRKNEPQREKDVREVDTKGKAQSSESTTSSKVIEAVPETRPVITKKMRNVNTETQKHEADIDTKTDDVKPTKETGAVVVKKVDITDSEIQKEAADIPVVNTESTVRSSEVRPYKDIDNAPKIENIMLRTVRKTNSKTQKEGADVAEVSTAISKEVNDVKPDSKLQKLPESSNITRKRIIVESETPSEVTEVLDNNRKLKKQPEHAEVTETNKFTLHDTRTDRMKDSEAYNIKKQQNTISEQADKARNLPAEVKKSQETVVSSNSVDSVIEKNNRKENTILLSNQSKGEKVLTTSHTKDSSQVEDERVVRKDKNVGDDRRITQSITPESEKDKVTTEKKQKDETVIINKRVSAPEEKLVTSEQVKAKTKTQEDQEQLVQKDEIVTDTQVIEEEIDDESTFSQNVEAASKQVVKSGAQNYVRRGKMSSQDRDALKHRAAQRVKTGTAGKVTAGRKAIIPKYSKLTMRGAQLKGRKATEYLFLLENDAEPTGNKDPTVAAELMKKLKVSKTQNYTTYHVNRGKEWSTKEDVSALILRVQISATKIRSISEISLPYLETIQELQKVSSKYIQGGYQTSLGTQVKLQIKQFEKSQNAYYAVENALQNEANVLTEVAVKAISEVRSGMFKMECFKDQYPVFEKFLIAAEPDKKDCYGNVRKLSEWTKAVPELWKNKERRLNKLQASMEKLKKSKEELKPGQNFKKSIAGLLCDIFNYMDVQTKFLNFSNNLGTIAKLARREINICNKKEPVDPALADADK